MKIIGITGGVGAGKTQILEYLNNRYGATICQTDAVGRKLQKKGTKCFEDIVECFGTGILDEKKVAKEKRKNTNLFIIESALLIESHYDQMCDEVWYVHVDAKTRKKRLVYARGYDPRKVDDIIAAQLPKEEFMKHCDRVIDNSNIFEETQMQLDRIIADL
ncbi:MAG: dephospho-CoA kinase [Dorea sp.]|nr:dephospho-CoA kinase [Dorea sp.]